MANYGGWTGKILRVNLTDGKITAEDTSKYYGYIGGSGFGHKVLWDEVPQGTKAYDPANKIIFSTGPLTGTGAVCSGRTTITSLGASNPYNAVIDSHFGGYFGVELKYAGWDAIIIEGKASRPVWLRIEDDTVRVEDARGMWGKGTFYAITEITSQMGQDAQAAVIGQAGENLVPISFIRTGSSHHGGGLGGVMGSKMLKGIGLRGTRSVRIAGDRAEWMKTMRENLKVIGANNQHVVPNSPQPWAEYTSATRWTAAKGRYWGAAQPPVETGTCDPKDINSIGFRTLKSVFDLGPMAEKYTVRMGGCASCPIRCHSQLVIPELEKYGYGPSVSSTCVGFSGPGAVMIKGYGAKDVAERNTFLARTIGAAVTNDYGIWCNYSQIAKDFKYAYTKGIFKKVLPPAEYASIPWNLLEAGDPAFLVDFYRRIALAEGEFSHMADGLYLVAKRWGYGDDFFDDEQYSVWSPLGYPKHHSNESDGQVGALLTFIKNRDPQNHSHQNFIGSGLPIEVQKSIAKEIWGGEDAIDPPMAYTPINQSKINFTKWSIVRNVLHDSLTLCNWMWPMTVSPLKELKYRGNTALESAYFSLATGMKKTEKELDANGEKITTLMRALTMKEMGTANMREKHDFVPSWVYETDPKKKFAKGSIKLDKDDLEKGKSMLYESFGWDTKTGAPTKATLIKHGMDDIAEGLSKQGLLSG
jgi:aldehyde:ferredoxin oxidoreductase